MNILDEEMVEHIDLRKDLVMLVVDVEGNLDNVPSASDCEGPDLGRSQGCSSWLPFHSPLHFDLRHPLLSQ